MLHRFGLPDAPKKSTPVAIILLHFKNLLYFCKRFTAINFMNLNEIILEKAKVLSNKEFVFTKTEALSETLQELDNGNSIVTNAAVLCTSIKDFPSIVKTKGKRAGATIHKMYGIAMDTFAAETKGIMVKNANGQFLLIYPSPLENVSEHVQNALRLCHILSKVMPREIPELAEIEFSIGLDYGHVLATKTDNGNLWLGTSIDKALAIGEQCQKPSRVGISGFVFRNTDETLKTTTKHLLGITKTEEIWQRNGYQFHNEHKHFYSTSHSIEE